MNHSQKYDSLFTLVDQNAEARQYFDKLPDYVRDQISQRAQSVNSLDSLQDYAENLLRGDD
mgnify:CR=1 FL=1